MQRIKSNLRHRLLKNLSTSTFIAKCRMLAKPFTFFITNPPNTARDQRFEGS